MRFLLPLFFLTNFSFAQNSVEEHFHPDSLRYVVTILSADSLKGRFSGSLEAGKVANFIALQFQQNGLKPVAGMNGFFMNVPGYGVNVISGIQGKEKPEEIIIFSAHYDHIGTSYTNEHKHLKYDKAEKGDTIYNGANDNASGIAALIALGKYYNSKQPLARTVLFVAFTGEEQGMIGSDYFANEINTGAIKAVINLEMLGRASEKERRPYITGYQLSSLYSILNNSLYEYDEGKYGKKYFLADPYEVHNLFQRSDNYPFSIKGVNAHTIMVTGPLDKYYHSLNDEVGTLDFELISNIVQAIAISCEGIVDGSETPLRTWKW